MIRQSKKAGVVNIYCHIAFRDLVFFGFTEFEKNYFLSFVFLGKEDFVSGAVLPSKKSIWLFFTNTILCNKKFIHFFFNFKRKSPRQKMPGTKRFLF